MAMVDSRPGSAGELDIFFHRVLDKCVEMDMYLVGLDDFSCDGGGIVKKYPPIPHPALRFQAPVPEPNYPSFCLHNSTLYMFDGYNPLTKPWFPPLPLKTKSAYKSSATLLDLSAQLKEKEKEKEEESRQQLVKMSSMNHAKGFPVAFPTPDGKKILVFSTNFIFARSDEAFELYDPEEGNFVALPELPLPHTDPECSCRICTITAEYDSEDNDGYNFDYDRLDDCDKTVVFVCHDVEEVVSYCFIGDSHFLLEMKFQVYALDLRDLAWATVPRRCVFPLHDPNQGFYDIHQGYFETFKGRYALIPGVKPVNRYCQPELLEAGVDQEVALYVHDVGKGTRFLPPSDEVTDGGGFFRPTYDKFLVSSIVLPEPDTWFNVCGYIIRAPAPIGIQKNGESESVCSCNTYVVQQAMRFDCEEFRLLIDVCRTDFTTTQPKTSIFKSASLSVCSSGESTLFPYTICFTL